MHSNTDIEKEFVEIISLHGNMIAKVCYMYGFDSDSRKDLQQECYANIWQGLRSFRGEAKLSSWIYRTCINTCISCYRRNSRHQGHLPLDNYTACVEEESDDKQTNLREMYRLIEQLNSIDKAIIMLWLDEKSYDEISEITGMLRNTVASRLRRIKEHLQNLSNL